MTMSNKVQLLAEVERLTEEVTTAKKEADAQLAEARKLSKALEEANKAKEDAEYQIEGHLRDAELRAELEHLRAME